MPPRKSARAAKGKAKSKKDIQEEEKAQEKSNDAEIALDDDDDDDDDANDAVEEAPSASGKAMTAKEKVAARLAALKEKRKAARASNHEQVVEEDRRAKLPANWEVKKKRAEWTLEEEKRKKEAEEKGLDYERIKAMNTSAEWAARKHAKRNAKRNPNKGFSDYEQATFNQYSRLTKKMRPDTLAHKNTTENWGEDYSADSLAYGKHQNTTADGVDNMVEDLKKIIDGRRNASRRRKVDEDDDIDYINEKNMRFNKKAERFFGNYTTEIKDNFERGTAI